MTPKQFRATLKRLRLTQLRVADLLGVSARTVRYWIAGTYPTPEAVALLLRIWLKERPLRSGQSYR